jgi:hypothetical protein
MSIVLKADVVGTTYAVAVTEHQINLLLDEWRSVHNEVPDTDEPRDDDPGSLEERLSNCDAQFIKLMKQFNPYVLFTINEKLHTVNWTQEDALAATLRELEAHLAYLEQRPRGVKFENGK